MDFKNGLKDIIKAFKITKFPTKANTNRITRPTNLYGK